MKRGKQTCKILKEIRRQIAEANDIEFVTSECQYQGDCLGTCPKCESEVRYLEQQLERRRMAGKAITVLGISAGLVTMSSISSCNSTPNKGTSQNATIDTIETVTQHDTVCDILEGDVALIEKEDTLKAPPGPPMHAGEIIELKTVDENPEDSIQATAKDIIMGKVITPDTSTGNNKAEKENNQPPRVVDLIGIIDVTYNDSISDVSAEDTLTVVPVMPEFPGGPNELMKFIGKNLKDPYPVTANGQMQSQARVIVQFIVDKNGGIVLPKVIRSVGPEYDKEALRVIKLMPKWKPGELEDGTKVAVKFTVPVLFRLQ